VNYVQPISLNDMNVPVNALTDPLFGKRILHGATFPEKLIEPLIKVGSMVGDTVLDPFCGTGTTGKVSLSNGKLELLGRCLYRMEGRVLDMRSIQASMK